MSSISIEDLAYKIDFLNELKYDIRNHQINLNDLTSMTQYYSSFYSDMTDEEARLWIEFLLYFIENKVIVFRQSQSKEWVDIGPKFSSYLYDLESESLFEYYKSKFESKKFDVSTLVNFFLDLLESKNKPTNYIFPIRILEVIFSYYSFLDEARIDYNDLEERYLEELNELLQRLSNLYRSSYINEESKG